MKFREFFAKHIPNFSSFNVNDRGEVNVPCLFHGQTDGASLNVSVESGKWKCHVPHCVGSRGGTYKKFEALVRGDTSGAVVKTPFIDKEIIEAHHKVLLQSKATLELLHKKRGLSLETIKRFKLGWDADRIWIPIPDADGNFVNVRKYKPGAVKDKMVAYDTGYNQARLFPVESLSSDWVILTEGETDCLVLMQEGYPALTSTGGADTWLEEFNRALKGKRVLICYDCDAAGKQGAQRVAVKLLDHAAEVRVVRLPLEGTKESKDITNYFVDLGNDRESFDRLLEEASEVKREVSSTGAPPDEVEPIHFSSIGEDRLVNRRVRSTVLVAGKDLAPFQVPYRIGYQCEMGEKQCGRCGIAMNGGTCEVQLPEWSSDFLSMINVSKEKLEFLIGRIAKVPSACPKFRYEVKEFANVESIKAIPEIDFASEKSEYVIRNLFYLGHGIETNHTYSIEAVVMPDPKTQFATALVYGAQPSQDNIEQFEMSAEMLEAFKKFRVEGGKK